MNNSDATLKVDEERHRLELETGPAFIEYKLVRDKLFLIHTEVPAILRGKGVGAVIVQRALQYAKDHGYKVVPICVYVQSYLKAHPEWKDIVAPDAERFIHKK